MSKTIEQTKDPPGDDKKDRLVPSLLVGFVFLSSYLIIHMIFVSSRHFAVAFNIPNHNIGIYISKLCSFRLLLSFVASLAEYCIYLAGGSSRYVRKVICFVVVLLMVITRIGFLVVLERSSSLSLHIYQILNLESVFHGFFQMGFFSLVPQYSSATNLSLFVSGFMVFICQHVIDIFLFDRPLLNIKVLGLIIVMLSSLSLCCWCYYLFYFEEVNENGMAKSNNSETEGDILQEEVQTGQSDTDKEPERKTADEKKQLGFWYHFANNLSPYFMFVATSLFKYFLSPGLLPYALLDPNKAHIINVVSPVFYILGSLTIFIPSELSERFRTEWYGAKNAFWLLTVPQLLIFILTIMAIHTRFHFATIFINSQWRVLLISVILIYCYTIMDALSIVGVLNYVFKSNDESSHGIITVHNITAIVSIFIFCKLSVGYNVTRISLGYCLPKFRPTHRMSKSNLAWHIIKNTFKKTAIDIINDFKMDIKRYL